MTTISNQNPIYPDYQLGKLTGGSKQVTIRDLMKYAKKKSCGRLWMTIKWIFTGKGLITKETASTLLQRHPQRDKILEEFKILKTLIKTQAVAQPILEKKEPGMGKLSIAKITEVKTTEQETPVATTKKIEEQKIEKIVPANISKVNPPKTQENELLEEYLRKGYSENIIKEALQVGMKVEEYAAMKIEDLEEARAQARAALEKLPLRNEEAKHTQKQEIRRENNSISSHFENREQETRKRASRKSEEIMSVGVKTVERSPKITSTSNEEMDLNEAYRIIKEALRIQTSGNPINDLKGRLNAEWLGVVLGMPRNLFLNEKLDKSSDKAITILEWAVQNREFPQLFKAMKIYAFSCKSLCSTIEAPDTLIAHKREFYKALHKVCLAPAEEASTVDLPNVDPLDFSQQYHILENALNTINDHNLHKSKYGSALHEFLTGLHEYSLQIALNLRISIPNSCEHRAIYLLQWALEHRKMPELYNAMGNCLKGLCRTIKCKFSEQVDPKKRFIFTTLHYVCRAIETPE